MFYLVTISNIFRKSSIDELSKIADFKVIEEFVDTLIISSKDNNFASKLANNRPIFVYDAFPLKRRSEIEKSRYLASLYAALKGRVPKTIPLRLECFDVNSKEGYSAKDIEVYLGQRLEKEGYNVNMEKPSILVYLVLINMRCYMGLISYEGLKHKFLNPERHYHAYANDTVSRSELKLRQAFDEFEIDGKGIAVDLGAAPGGWSRFLAQKGYSVVAIDNGNLDYKKLKDSKILVTTGRNIRPDKLEKGSIIHLKSDASRVHLPKGLKATLLADDMNLEPKDSARILKSFSRNLEKGSAVVMTIKCIDRNAEKHIKNAENVLGKNFTIRGLKVLPSNRQEVTLYATFKEG